METKLIYEDKPWGESKFVIPDGIVTKKLKFDFTNHEDYSYIHIGMLRFYIHKDDPDAMEHAEAKREYDEKKQEEEENNEEENSDHENSDHENSVGEPEEYGREENEEEY